jgi:hypothetical protein
VSGETSSEAAPNWQRTIHTLEWLLASLDPTTHFQILFFNDETTPILPSRAGEWFTTSDKRTVSEILAQLHRVVPRGRANLEQAFASVRTLDHPPAQIVLLTDGLPTASDSSPLTTSSSEEQRLRWFQIAAKQLPLRIPVSTALLSRAPGESTAAGAYWGLANATRGALVSPANTAPTAATGTRDPQRIAFVIDASGSMRDPVGGSLWPIVVAKIEEVLEAHPNLAGVQLLDANGNFILGRANTWLPVTPELRSEIALTLRRYAGDNHSNPVPGISNVLRKLHQPDDRDASLAIYIFGDEFNSGDNAETVIDRLDRLNPRDANGQRRVVINAVGFPTMIRGSFSMGNTGVRFADLMHRITHEHGGTFVALPDLLRGP